MNKDVDGFCTLFNAENTMVGELIEIRDSFYDCDPFTNAMLQNMEDKDTVKAAGYFLGKKKGSTFIPSTILLERIAKKTNNKIWLNEKGSWLFVCGRDVFSESILREGELDRRDKYVLVMNAKDEPIGYGIFTKMGSIVVKNLFDIGDFLRREK